MGDPVEVGSSLLPTRPLIGPHHTRLYVVHTLIVFAAHFLLVVGATLSDAALRLGPFHVPPIADPRHPIELVMRVLRTLIFDAGLVLAVYALLPRVGRLVGFPRTALSVRPTAARCLRGAFFLGLVLLVVNVFRDSLFALYVRDGVGEGMLRIPFTGRGISDNLLLLNIWLGLSIVREILYAKWGERRVTLGLDLVATLSGLFCLLRIVATKQLVDLTSTAATEELGASADTAAAVLNTVFVAIALIAAAALAVRVVRRGFRLAQVRN